MDEVREGKYTMEQLVAQLSVEEMARMFPRVSGGKCMTSCKIQTYPSTPAAPLGRRGRQPEAI